MENIINKRIQLTINQIEESLDDYNAEFFKHELMIYFVNQIWRPLKKQTFNDVCIRVENTMIDTKK